MTIGPPPLVKLPPPEELEEPEDVDIPDDPPPEEPLLPVYVPPEEGEAEELAALPSPDDVKEDGVPQI